MRHLLLCAGVTNKGVSLMYGTVRTLHYDDNMYLIDEMNFKKNK